MVNISVVVLHLMIVIDKTCSATMDKDSGKYTYGCQ